MSAALVIDIIQGNEETYTTEADCRATSSYRTLQRVTGKGAWSLANRQTHMQSDTLRTCLGDSDRSTDQTNFVARCALHKG